MKQEWVDPSSRSQVTIMVLTTAVEFACGFGLLALLIVGLWEVADGTMSVRRMIALSICFGVTLWTGYRAMRLVVRPTWAGMGVVAVSAFVALVPLVALEL